MIKNCLIFINNVKVLIFLHIKNRHNVNFYQNELCFLLSTWILFKSYTILDDENDC